jgi:hypothetical protein
MIALTARQFASVQTGIGTILLGTTDNNAIGILDARVAGAGSAGVAALVLTTAATIAAAVTTTTITAAVSALIIATSVTALIIAAAIAAAVFATLAIFTTITATIATGATFKIL